MDIVIGAIVTLPRFAPYPRHGRVAEIRDDSVVVEDVVCGDPRCAAEHSHGTQVWAKDSLEAGNAYQPRASWELGRKSSPNAPVS